MITFAGYIFFTVTLPPSQGWAAGSNVALDGGKGGTLSSAVGGGHLTFSLTPTQSNRAGGNVFYTFKQLSIANGDAVSFTGAGINNTLARVTGGQPSNISGALSVESGNFFLMNPNGVMFGPGAQLAVNGSFTVTTASVIRFSDGIAFSGVADRGSALLSTKSPAAFGFLSRKPAAISVTGTSLSVPAAKSLSLVGGPVQISNASLFFTPTSTAQGGQVNLISAGGTGVVKLDTTSLPATPEFSSLGKRGPVTVTNGSKIDASTIESGNSKIEVVGSDVTVSDSIVFAQHNPVPAGQVAAMPDQGLLRQGIKIDSTGTFTLQNTGPDGAAATGGMRAKVSVTSLGNARAGDIDITAHSMQVLDGGQMNDDTNGPGAGGNITIDLSGGLLVDNRGRPSSANKGVISIISCDAANKATGAGGTLSIDAASVQILYGAQIGSGTTGLGDGGNVSVNATGRILLDESPTQSEPYFLGVGVTGITASSNMKTTGGRAGNIKLSSDSLLIRNGARISSDTFGFSGEFLKPFVAIPTVNVKARSITVDGLDGRNPNPRRSEISANTNNPGMGDPAGSVIVHAGRLLVSNGGTVASGTFGNGAGGPVRVAAESISLRSGGQISSATGPDLSKMPLTLTTGPAGSVNVRAKTLRIAGSATKHDGTGIVTNSTKMSGGSGGSIKVNADQVKVSGFGKIAADAVESNVSAGSVTINAPISLVMSQGAAISTSAAGQNAPGGDIKISALEARLTGHALIDANSANQTAGTVSLKRAIFSAPPDLDLNLNSAQIATAPGPVITAETESKPVKLQPNNIFFIANTNDAIAGRVTVIQDAPALPALKLQARCSQLIGERFSSFTVAGTGGEASEPGTWMPEFDIDGGSQGEQGGVPSPVVEPAASAESHGPANDLTGRSRE